MILLFFPRRAMSPRFGGNLPPVRDYVDFSPSLGHATPGGPLFVDGEAELDAISLADSALSLYVLEILARGWIAPLVPYDPGRRLVRVSFVSAFVRRFLRSDTWVEFPAAGENVPLRCWLTAASSKFPPTVLFGLSEMRPPFDHCTHACAMRQRPSLLFRSHRPRAFSIEIQAFPSLVVSPTSRL